MTRPILVRRLMVGYDGRAVAGPVDLDISADCVMWVVGPNAIGKTTLLKTLGGLIEPIAGSIDPRLRAGRRGSVYVHPTPFLFAGTVGYNLLTAAHGHEAVARQALDRLGAGGLWDRDSHAISTGQQQRVGIARALAVEPVLLLVDEPEGGMDAEAIAAWRSVMLEATTRGGPAIVVAAHRPVAFDNLPTRVVPLGLDPVPDSR